MAMDLTDDFTTMHETQEFGETATYTAPAGSPVDCTVIINTVAEILGEHVEVIQGDHTISILTDDVASPARDGTITIASGEYSGSYLLNYKIDNDGTKYATLWTATKVVS